MQYFDILIFALIAVFLGLRLRSVLGSRTGEEKPPTDPYAPRQSEPDQGKVVRFPGQPQPSEVSDAEFEDVKPTEAPAQPVDFSSFGPAGLGLEAIAKADPRFDPRSFQDGAKAAFEMIVQAFAKGDAKTLKMLLAGHVYKDFTSAIDARAKQGQTLVSDLVGITECKIEAARLDNWEAFVTVRYVSEQVNGLKDKTGAVIEGDPSKVERVVDIWTFMRDIRSKDPNWSLVETLTPE